ncbi:MAG: UDP-4-amino-4,6-dideoxy-N-acetyl-beta-L-altrosamine transaminase [Chloroflexi bacterium]|nr:UDP-4-amino-4,6-dideoxy-N-acetyl-beta-L-altrosamine transaminase [Chloroflexota bacterium]
MNEPHSDQTPLAIHGGSPVRPSPLPYGRQLIDDNDIEAVVEVLRSDWITTGPKVKEFEDAVANLVGARYAVAYSSGTSALHGAAFAAGLGPGDEAITTPLTFCATANCALYTGATPVFADIRSDTMNIDPSEIERRITPRTKALLPVDYAGHPADLDPILSLAEKHGLVVIEDAAHALGSTYRDRNVGGVSHMTTFSFHPVKHVTTGEGGMVTTNDPELARSLRRFRTHGVDEEVRREQGATKGQWYYEMTELGYNYRLSDIACALGVSQLKKLPENIASRRKIVDWYAEAFSESPGLIIPIEEPSMMSAWHLYPLRLDLQRFSVGRKEIFQALRAENILVNVHYIPVHLHPYYRERFGYEGGEFPVAEAAYESMITLPLFHSMTKQDAVDVIAAVRKVTRHYSRS